MTNAYAAVAPTNPLPTMPVFITINSYDIFLVIARRVIFPTTPYSPALALGASEQSYE
jgi:hypothetical protein